MEALVRQAMAEGAVGLSAALIYAPDSYADTTELIALARAAAEYDGLFAAHLRSEGETFLEDVYKRQSSARPCPCQELGSVTDPLAR